MSLVDPLSLLHLRQINSSPVCRAFRCQVVPPRVRDEVAGRRVDIDIEIMGRENRRPTQAVFLIQI